MSGKPHRTQLIKSIFFLGLFLFALVAQGVHQLNNPAETPRECGSVDLHFHQDSPGHSCDLCDYKINVEVQFQVNRSTPLLAADLIQSGFDGIIPELYLEFHQRGPPQF